MIADVVTGKVDVRKAVEEIEKVEVRSEKEEEEELEEMLEEGVVGGNIGGG